MTAIGPQETPSTELYRLEIGPGGDRLVPVATEAQATHVGLRLVQERITTYKTLLTAAQERTRSLEAALADTERRRHEAVGQVITRHGLRSFPSPEPTPSARQIESLRAIEPVSVVRYTLESLLLTQARRAQDYDPGAVTADPVLALYLPGQAPETTDGVA